MRPPFGWGHKIVVDSFGWLHLLDFPFLIMKFNDLSHENRFIYLLTQVARKKISGEPHPWSRDH